MKQLNFKVNGQRQGVTVDPGSLILFVLSHDLGLRGPRFGSGMAQCGALAVITKRRAVQSRMVPAIAVGEAQVTTPKGLGTPEEPQPIQRAFIDEDGAQWGFCLSGVILTAKAVLDGKPDASDGQGINSVQCSTCHQDPNLAGAHTPPGSSDWRMPPLETPMIWQGLTDGQLCELLKDPKQNGQRSIRQVVEHTSTRVVLWGWNPGEGLTPPPMKLSEFQSRVTNWAATGPACPLEPGAGR